MWYECSTVVERNPIIDKLPIDRGSCLRSITSAKRSIGTTWFAYFHTRYTITLTSTGTRIATSVFFFSVYGIFSFRHNFISRRRFWRINAFALMAINESIYSERSRTKRMLMIGHLESYTPLHGGERSKPGRRTLRRHRHVVIQWGTSTVQWLFPWSITRFWTIVRVWQLNTNWWIRSTLMSIFIIYTDPVERWKMPLECLGSTRVIALISQNRFEAHDRDVIAAFTIIARMELIFYTMH